MRAWAIMVVNGKAWVGDNAVVNGRAWTCAVMRRYDNALVRCVGNR